MNSSSANSSQVISPSPFCLNETFDLILQYHLRVLIVTLGTILNTFCIIVFIKIIRLQTDNITSNYMFKFFVLKSICEFILSLIELPIALQIIHDFKKSKIYFVWYIAFYNYIGNVVKLMSPYYEIEASIYCVLLIYRIGHECLKSKLLFYLVTISTCVFSISFYISTIFFFGIIKLDEHVYSLILTPLYRSDIGKVIIYAHSILRDILPLVLLFILDVFIIVFLKKTTKRREQLAESSSGMKSISTMLKVTNKMVSRSQNAEQNKIKMIFFTSLINLCHLPIIVRNLQNNILLNQVCFPKIALLLLDLSYTIPIISYILFNNNFKRIFFGFFKLL
jgi:hypothetical protein